MVYLNHYSDRTLDVIATAASGEAKEEATEVSTFTMNKIMNLIAFGDKNNVLDDVDDREEWEVETRDNDDGPNHDVYNENEQSNSCRDFFCDEDNNNNKGVHVASNVSNKKKKTKSIINKIQVIDDVEIGIAIEVEILAAGIGTRRERRKKPSGARRQMLLTSCSSSSSLSSAAIRRQLLEEEPSLSEQQQNEIGIEKPVLTIVTEKEYDEGKEALASVSAATVASTSVATAAAAQAKLALASPEVSPPPSAIATAMATAMTTKSRRKIQRRKLKLLHVKEETTKIAAPHSEDAKGNNSNDINKGEKLKQRRVPKSRNNNNSNNNEEQRRDQIIQELDRERERLVKRKIELEHKRERERQQRNQEAELSLGQDHKQNDDTKRKKNTTRKIPPELRELIHEWRKKNQEKLANDTDDDIDDADTDIIIMNSFYENEFKNKSESSPSSSMSSISSSSSSGSSSGSESSTSSSMSSKTSLSYFKWLKKRIEMKERNKMKMNKKDTATTTAQANTTTTGYGFQWF